MSLFSRLKARFDQKSSAVAALSTGIETAWVGLNPPRWGARDYRSLVQAGYMRNAVAHRAVRLVAECAASVPLLLRRDGASEPLHPLLKLLTHPNPAQSGFELAESLFADLLLAGNAYLECVDGADGGPAELYVLRPDRISVVPGPKGWPRAYDYRAGGRTHRFTVEALTGESPVIHIRSFHPLDETYGFAALNAAAAGIDLHNAAADWNKALLDNAARPSGALVFEPRDGRPETLTETQFARLKAELEEQYQGARNAGRPFLLEGGLKWQQIALTPHDMDFAEARHAAAREIALAFGVPPQLLGIPGDNTYANYQEANRALWRMTILPLVGRVVATLNLKLAARFGDDVALEADLDNLPALTPERDALWARLGATDFMTLNEKRAAIGLEPVEEAPAGSALDLKFNPNHREDNGQFDFANGGGGGTTGQPNPPSAAPKGPSVRLDGSPAMRGSSEAVPNATAVATPGTADSDVDWSTIGQWEGNQQLAAYVPKDKSGTPILNSGVTVASGVDLGSKSERGLKDIGVSEALVDKLKPYLGKTKSKAVDALRDNGDLVLTQEEADELDQAIRDTELDAVRTRYDAAVAAADAADRKNKVDNPPKRKTFDELDAAAKTIVASTGFNMGAGYGSVTNVNKKKLWKDLVDQDYNGAHEALTSLAKEPGANKGVANRRKKEAAYLKENFLGKTAPAGG